MRLHEICMFIQINYFAFFTIILIIDIFKSIFQVIDIKLKLNHLCVWWGVCV